MSKLIVSGDIKPGDVLVIDRVAGNTVHARVLDTSKPQVRQGPQFKAKPSREKRGRNQGGN